MRKVMLVMLLLGGWLKPAGAQEAADPGAIRQVIQGQLTAFGHDDGPLAFSFASPGIQNIFGSPDRFLAMVRTAYGAVYRPREVEFRELAVENGSPVQRVLLVGPDGVPVVARYSMEQQADGSWKISGCVLEQAPDLTT